MEKEVIQSVGFRNIRENGTITGFQFKIRLPYYRGVFLSQLRPGTLIVDGERFEKEEIIWQINGEEYTYEEMKKDFRTHWGTGTPATLKVKKEGGRHSVFLLLTDIMKEGSEMLIASDDPSVVEKAFNVKPEGKHVWLKGVMSRKKQVVPNFEKAFK